MVTLLITSILVLGLVAIAIYFWQKPAQNSETRELPPPPYAASLFTNPEPMQITAAVEDQVEAEKDAAKQTEDDEIEAKKADAEAFIASWRESPDRKTTAKMLHLAALVDDAETYRQAVESALTVWQRGSLPDLSAAELQTLFNSEFWLLSSRTRSSGAGFVLKRTLSRAKRELETS
jgi:hypothetical protein